MTVDSIEMETVHLLHFDRGISIKDIEKTAILSTNLHDTKEKSGLIHEASQRDLFKWAGATPIEGNPLPRPLITSASDLRKRVKTVLSDFCPNLNCVQPYCSVHGALITLA